MSVLVWHVHGSYLEAVIRGQHRYLLPVLPGHPEGRRRDGWPEKVVELTPEEGREADVDVVVAQRLGDLNEVPRWLGGRVPGRDVPAVFLEHNVPQGAVNSMRHPLADREDLVIVHVTHFNDLFWDCGSTPTRVVEHGIPDPGHRYTGELPRIAAVINEARRRRRVTGT
ncbi:MAG TPA: hypothetical protein VE219_07110, partial [Candidatus Sulfotelmatobacter sp.]|nr:hypothetical protein [Candidatus Sulfotelmatobacter sp.]